MEIINNGEIETWEFNELKMTEEQAVEIVKELIEYLDETGDDCIENSQYYAIKKLLQIYNNYKLKYLDLSEVATNQLKSLINDRDNNYISKEKIKELLEE